MITPCIKPSRSRSRSPRRRRQPPTASALLSLATIPPISLSAMDEARLMDRIDVKYALAEGRLEELLSVAAPDYRVLEVEGVRTTRYKTLYFDWQDRACYLQHHNGKRNRYKVRKRRYDSSGACFLEVKAKNNRGRTEKVRRPIGSLATELLPAEVAFLEETLQTTPRLQAAVLTEFRRITLVHCNQPERVTIDWDLSFQSGEQLKTFPGIAVIEVKQARDDRQTPLRRKLRTWHVRPLRVSKYCLGTVLLNPDLKSNRFKATLRALSQVA